MALDRMVSGVQTQHSPDVLPKLLSLLVFLRSKFFIGNSHFLTPSSVSGDVLLPAAEVPRVGVRHRLRVPARLPPPHRPPAGPPQDQPIAHSGHINIVKMKFYDTVREWKKCHKGRFVHDPEILH